jgi:hypothetical protein
MVNVVLRRSAAVRLRDSAQDGRCEWVGCGTTEQLKSPLSGDCEIVPMPGRNEEFP